VRRSAYDPQRALQLLRLGSQRPDAAFRDGQEDAIRHVVEGRGRLLVVQKTGWGKSFVYFIAAKLLREAGAGPALLVSPLLALMRNQVAAAERLGLRAETLNSGNKADWPGIVERIGAGEVDILLFHPKQLASVRFANTVLAPIAGRVSLLVVDEAHCVSDWGHDFVPEYRIVQRTARSLPANLRLLATTATANNRVMEDLTDILGPNLKVVRGDLNRPSLTLQTISLPGQAERLAWLAEQLAALPGHGIVYTLTVHDAEQVAGWLRTRGIAAEAYTSRSGGREGLEQALLDNQVKVLVATTALGMGFDKPDLAFVIHYQMPGSVVAYYQQVGRAGRAVASAYGVLLSGDEEDDIVDWFIDTPFPTREEVDAVLQALDDAPGGLTTPGILGRVNLSWHRLDKALTLMSLEAPAPIVKQDGRWRLTAADLAESFWGRADRLTRLRREEQQQMREYVALPFGQHMRFLIEALDGDGATASSPGLPPLRTGVDPLLARDAAAYLRRGSLVIDPRRQWPADGLPGYGVKGNIAAAGQAQSGRALCTWGDAGWGQQVRDGKYRHEHFSEELMLACEGMMNEWNPLPAPAWVTCIPSHRHPGLVSDLARRLAARLRLPFHGILLSAGERAEQKGMENSAHRVRNLDGAFGLRDGPVPSGPVLLVDDMVDSRWTLTVAAWLLQRGGSGAVWPMVLAAAGQAG